MVERIAFAILEESAAGRGGLEFKTLRLRSVGGTDEEALHCGQALHRVGLLRTSGAGTVAGFAHRRYAEYFAASSLAADEALGRIATVLRDNNHPWRDALGVYCETADEDVLKRVVQQSWELVSPLIAGAPITRRQQGDARMALDFLLASVRGRPAAMLKHRAALADFVVQTAENPRQRLLAIREAAEWTGLLAGEDLRRALFAILERRSWWVLEGALFSCRYNEKPTWGVNQRALYIIELNPLRLVTDRGGILSLLKRSRGFRPSWRGAFLRRIDVCTLALALVVVVSVCTVFGWIIVFGVASTFTSRSSIEAGKIKRRRFRPIYRRLKRHALEKVLPGNTKMELMMRGLLSWFLLLAIHADNSEDPILRHHDLLSLGWAVIAAAVVLP